MNAGDLVALAAQTPDSGAPPVPGPDDAPAPSINELLQQAARMRMLDGADTTSGAPVPVRAAVGASAPDDRLAALRGFYPDADVLPGTDNFVYTDSAGRRASYEPIGWRVPTMGDIASVGPEIAEGVGGTLGGLGGSLVSPVIGTAAGAGAGAVAGREAYDSIMRFLAGAMDTRTPLQRAGADAVTGAVNAVLPGVSEAAIGPMIGELMRPAAGTLTRQAADALDAAGVTGNLTRTLPAGVIGESPGWQRIEQAVLQMPTTGGLRDAYANSKDALAAGLQNVAQRAAGPVPVPDADTFASNVAGIANDIHNNFKTTREALDQALENQIGRGTGVSIEPLRQLRGDLAAQQSEAQESLAPRYQPAIDFLDQTIRDARTAGNMGQISFGAMRQIRTDLGNRVEWPMGVGGDVPTGNPALRQAYGAVKQSISDAAADAGPAAQTALMDHDSLVARYMAPNGPNETMASLADPKTNAMALTRLATSTAPADAQSLMHLWSAASPAQQGEIQAGLIQRLGTPPSGADFDPGVFLRNYQKTTDGARDLVFGPQGTPQRDALDNLMTVQRTLGTSAGYRGTSNTGAVLAAVNALSAMGGHLIAGAPGAAAGAGVGTFGGPWAAGKLLTSAPFSRWLAGTYGVNANQAGQWARHLGQLGAVSAADPAISDLVTRYRAGLPETLPGSQP
jgi:hypothetical protein